MPDPFDVYLSSPMIFESAVYFGSSDGNVYAVDANTGNLKWKFKTGDVVHATPAIANGTVYVGSWDSNFYALDAATGKEKWRFKTGEDPDIHNQVGIQSSAAVMDGMAVPSTVLAIQPEPRHKAKAQAARASVNNITRDLLCRSTHSA